MTNTTDRHASPSVMRALKAATKGQRRTYMMRGEPQALIGQYLVTEGERAGEAVERIHPSLRGIILGDPADTIEDAVAKAAEVVARLRAEGPGEPFDEIALGIDDEARDLARRFEDVGARIETIVHLGTMNDGDPTETLARMIEDLCADDVAALSAQLPFLPELQKYRDLAAGEDGEDDAMDDDEFVQEFLARAHQDGSQGFLVEVSVPEMTPHATGGCSIHLGTRNLAVRYGSTYATACRLALEWAEAHIAHMMARVAA